MRYSFFLLFLVCSCTYTEVMPIYGCDDPAALNYDALVTANDGSCAYLCNPDQQVFYDLVQPIIEANCMECHNESSGRQAILTTYDGVIDAVNNHLLKDQVVSLQMPPSSPLSVLEINIIINWVDCE